MASPTQPGIGSVRFDRTRPGLDPDPDPRSLLFRPRSRLVIYESTTEIDPESADHLFYDLQQKIATSNGYPVLQKESGVKEMVGREMEGVTVRARFV